MKRWPWNPPTPYDNKEEQEPLMYNIMHDFLLTIALIVLVSVVLIMLSR